MGLREKAFKPVFNISQNPSGLPADNKPGNKDAAAVFIDFLLRPEISAQIISETYYWLPNDAAMELLDPELRENTAIFPTDEMLRSAEIMLPLSPEAESRYAEIWEQFLAANE